MIGIIAAMPEEINELLAFMNDVEQRQISNVHFFIGKIQKQEVVLMQSGVGKGNAAMATTILLEHFVISHIINIGTAGGLHEKENILDIVVSDEVVQHDYDTSGLDGEEGIGLYFHCDDKLLKVCSSVLEDLNKSFHVGLIASGDQFIHDSTQLQKLMHRFPKAICAEMEAGAIAQVCSSYQIPYIILRSLSDIACKEDSHMDFIEYVKHASKASAIVCEQIVSHIS